MPAGNATVTVTVLGNSKGLEQNLASIEGSVAGHLGKVSKNAEEAGGRFDTLGQKAEGASKGTQQLSSGLGTVAEGFAAVKVVESVADDFSKLESATVALGTAMRNAGEAQSTEFKDGLEAAQAAGEKLGFAAGDTTQALAQLRLAGVNTSVGMKDLPTIMDLARAKNISLSDATSAVVKAMQGSAKALKDLNVEMPPTLATTVKLDAANQLLAKDEAAVTLAQEKHTAAVRQHGPASAQAEAAAQNLTKAEDVLTAQHAKVALAQSQVSDRTSNLSAVMDILSAKVGGQASAAASTMSGRLNVMKTEVIGAATNLVVGLEPALGGVVSALGFLTDHMNIVLPVLGVLIGLFVAWKTAMLIATVIEAVSTAIGGLNVALLFLAANPIVLVIAAVVAIVAALVALELKFHFVEAAARWLGDKLGPIFGAIGTIIGDIVGPIKDVIDWVANHLGPVFAPILAIAGPIFKGIADAINAIVTAIKSVIDFLGKMKDAIAGAATNKIQVPPGWKPGDPIPTHHTGGVVAGPAGAQMLIVARAGERVVPPSGAGGGGGGDNLTFNLQTSADPHAIAAEVMWRMKTGRA